MAVRQSIRISIRWLPDPPSEPTDTLVFGVGEWFIDLRVTKSDGSIDWAMAGTKEVLSKEPLKCRWIHVIDSRGSVDPDEGSFQALPNGDDLETGSMPCPEKGNAITPYEEVWREIPPAPGPKQAWILQSVEDEGKTFLGRVGGIYMALKQGADGSFGARREEWKEEGWQIKYQIGLDSVPSIAGTGKSEYDGEQSWRVDETVDVLGQKYKVRAWEKW